MFIAGVYLFFAIILSVIFKLIENRFLSYEKKAEKESLLTTLKNIFSKDIMEDRSKLLDRGEI